METKANIKQTEVEPAKTTKLGDLYRSLNQNYDTPCLGDACQRKVAAAITKYIASKKEFKKDIQPDAFVQGYLSGNIRISKEQFAELTKMVNTIVDSAAKEANNAIDKGGDGKKYSAAEIKAAKNEFVTIISQLRN